MSRPSSTVTQSKASSKVTTSSAFNGNNSTFNGSNNGSAGGSTVLNSTMDLLEQLVAECADGYKPDATAQSVSV